MVGLLSWWGFRMVGIGRLFEVSVEDGGCHLAAGLDLDTDRLVMP
jgi:hypothetical protein